MTRDEVKTAYLAKQERIYEAGDKGGKMLAWLGSREREGLMVREVELPSGEVVKGSEQIAEEFAKYIKDF